MKWLLVALVGLLALGGPAAFHTVHADTTPTLTPIVDCIRFDAPGTTVTVEWGYQSTYTTEVVIATGSNNLFQPPPSFQGQPIDFSPGTFTNVFTTTFSTAVNPSSTWKLGGNTATASTASPYCVKGSPPVSSSPPNVIGTPQVGQTLTAADGDWLSECAVSFGDTWQTSRNNGPWTQVGTDATYTPATADLGAMIRVEVVASNCNGTASAIDSAAVGPITAAPPAIAAPLLPLVDCVTFNGTANTLTVQWASYSAYAQTQTVAAGTNNAVSPTPASGAPTTSFAPGLNHNAWTATLNLAQATQLTWTLNGVSATASAANPECGESSPPSNQTPPAAIGTPAVGQTLTADDGEWLANCAVSFTNTWQRSSNGGAWTAVGTGNTYAPVAADVGALLRVEVLASDCHGAASALDSLAVGPVTAPEQAPVNTSAPTITSSKDRHDDAQHGRPQATLTATAGAWTGTPAPTLRYQWQRCTDTACTDIQGANETTYTPRDADQGEQLRVVVTATNSAGSAIAVSAETDPINGSGSPRGDSGSSGDR